MPDKKHSGLLSLRMGLNYSLCPNLIAFIAILFTFYASHKNVHGGPLVTCQFSRYTYNMNGSFFRFVDRRKMSYDTLNTGIVQNALSHFISLPQDTDHRFVFIFNSILNCTISFNIHYHCVET